MIVSIYQVPAGALTGGQILARATLFWKSGTGPAAQDAGAGVTSVKLVVDALRKKYKKTVLISGAAVAMHNGMCRNLLPWPGH
jgi:hypothetical protein